MFCWVSPNWGTLYTWWMLLVSSGETSLMVCKMFDYRFAGYYWMVLAKMLDSSDQHYRIWMGLHVITAQGPFDWTVELAQRDYFALLSCKCPHFFLLLTASHLAFLSVSGYPQTSSFSVVFSTFDLLLAISLLLPLSQALYIILVLHPCLSSFNSFSPIPPSCILQISVSLLSH